jgi:uncharacterized membrane protein YkvA (DUF1232 family)
MSLKLTIELSNTDLDHFRREMRAARSVAKERGEDEVITASEALLGKVETEAAPEFIRDRLQRIKVLVDMLRDTEWGLPDAERGRVLTALAYFCEPEDIIPDEVPGLGLLDDAIMVELVVRELRHEIEAYEDFCNYRADHESSDTDVDRKEWISARRQALQSRMRNRRRRERERRRSPRGRRSPFSLF